MGELVGLGVGIGLFLVWSAFAVPARSPEARRPVNDLLTELLARAGMVDVRAGSLVGLCCVLLTVAFVVMWALSGAWPIAMAFAVMAGWTPISLLRTRARRRQDAFAQVWPDAVDNVASAVRAGMSLPDALSGLATSGPPPLRPAFGAFALDYQVSGRFSDSLDRLKRTLSDPVGDRMIEGIRVAREVGGGDLGRLLRNLSQYLREDARTRSELVARQSWTVNGARLAVASPWAVLLLMTFQSGAARAYASPTGALVLLVGAVACVVAYTLMTRVGRLPTDRRILG
ncbi:type II secretion system F family protein [Nocardioides yefusunii]|uniref:Type II secretion system F family protein n=1 Tax=Nocardioides yefusunii TaxID=2500546 RepID=A0ABW1QVC9_9ACTN|nr:type II secretion system F family protein [Nocardioides yefusunii]